MRSITFHPSSLAIVLCVPLLYSKDQPEFFMALGMWIVVLFLHEAGHNIYWKFAGYSVRIDVGLLGCTTTPTAPTSPLHKAANALAGLAVSCGAAIVPYILQVHITNFWLLWVHFHLICFFYQLLPIEDLDGWRLLKSLLEVVLGAYATPISYALSFLFTLGLTIGCLIVSSHIGFLPAAISLALSFHALLGLRNNQFFGPVDTSPQLQDKLKKALELYQQGSIVKAQQTIQELLAMGGKGQIIIKAKFILARWLLEAANPQEAWALIEPISKPRLAGSDIQTVHLVAYQSEHFEKVRELAPQVYQDYPNSSTAMINAITCARLHGQESCEKQKNQLLYEAIGWLQAAKRGNFNHWTILKGTDFQSVRGLNLFEDFCQSVYTQEI